jgi:hypothetical protein
MIVDAPWYVPNTIIRVIGSQTRDFPRHYHLRYHVAQTVSEPLHKQEPLKLFLCRCEFFYFRYTDPHSKTSTIWEPLRYATPVTSRNPCFLIGILV